MLVRQYRPARRPLTSSSTKQKFNNPRALTRSHPASRVKFTYYPQQAHHIHSTGPASGELRPSSYHKLSTFHSESPRSWLKDVDKHPYEGPHFQPLNLSDKFAQFVVRVLRVGSDWYFKENLIRRAVMLETVAAVPGMVAGMTRHLRSLRTMEHDNWIKTLLDEAENERMHLWAFMEISKPGLKDRMVIAGVQGIFWNIFFLFYLISPRTAHRFVGYLEEEAVKTYTHFLELIDNGRIQNQPAPKLAKDYWGLPDDATLRDMVLVIREDEADHRDVNHTMSNYLNGLKEKTIEFKDINI